MQNQKLTGKQDEVIQIPDAELSPFAEHDVWTRTNVDMEDDYRARTINILAGSIEDLIAQRAQERLDAARPAKWAA